MGRKFIFSPYSFLSLFFFFFLRGGGEEEMTEICTHKNIKNRKLQKKEEKKVPSRHK